MKQTGNGRESKASAMDFVPLERSQLVFRLPFPKAKVLSFNFIRDDRQDAPKG